MGIESNTLQFSSNPQMLPLIVRIFYKAIPEIVENQLMEVKGSPTSTHQLFNFVNEEGHMLPKRELGLYIDFVGQRKSEVIP